MQQRYRLIEILGRGGGGQVYKAWDEQLGREVALKFLNAVGPEHATQLVTEARTQARVRHSGVCQVYEVVESAGRPFIVMQLIDGPTLQAAAAQLTQREAVEVVRQVAEAVDAAHQLGIMHRDLKPSNIMLERTSDGWRPYVLDFGLAREVDQSLTHGMVGTPQFMAPEQARGDTAAIGPPTDIWALGATLYTLLAGRPPFDGDSALEILRQVESEEPPRMAGVPPELEAVVLRCLERSPPQRYDSAAALARDLAAFGRGDPVSARAPGLGRRALARARRHRTLFAVALVVAAGLPLALALRRPAQPWRAVARELQPSYEEHASQVGISPDGKWMLFDSFRGGEQQLYIQSVEGGPSRLLRRAGRASALSWSSDGKSVYFAREDTHIERMPIDESADPVEVAIGSNDDARECAGRLFYVDRTQRFDRLMVRSPDGSVRELNRYTGTIEYPACSRDGRRVVYRRGPGDYAMKLAWLDVETGIEHVLPLPFGYPGPAVFHPDGRSVVVGVRDGARSTLWETPIDGGPARQLTDGGYERFPELTPDGRRLFYNFDNIAEVLTIRALDGTPLRTSPSAGSRAGLDPTPDGREIISQRQSEHGLFEVVAVSTTDDSERVIAPRGDLVALSPDGAQILFLGGEHNDVVWVQPRAGGPARQLARLPAEPMWMHAAPDALLLLVGDEERRTWRQPYDGSPGAFAPPLGDDVVIPAAGGFRLTYAADGRVIIVPPGPWPSPLPPPTRFIGFYLTADRRAFVSPVGDSEVWMVTIATGEARLLAKVPGVAQAALSADGKQLYTIDVVHHTRRMEITNYAELPRP